jgi:EmrB/QacA subfamily drug resistance transporter
MEIEARAPLHAKSPQTDPDEGGPGEAWWLGLERKWWTLLVVGAGTFMAAVTSSVVNTVLSIIMKSFDVDLATAEWIVMINMVVVCGTLLTFGRLGDLVGHKRIFILGCGLFTLVSGLCGIAPTASILIGLRGMQAVGAAMLIATTPAILTIAFPRRQRGQVLGLQGALTYIGLAVGPVIGGYLTSRLGWQAIFLFNLPAGVIIAMVAYVAISGTRLPSREERFDPAGAIAFMVGLSAILLALSHGQSWGWGSGAVLGLLALGSTMLAIFVSIERRIAFPMLDLSLFRARLFTAASISSLMNYVCMNSVAFLMPFYLIQYRGFDPEWAGLLLSSQALIMAIVAPLSGSLSDRIGSRLLSTLGMAIATCGTMWLSTVGPDASTAQIVAYLMLIGLGTGIFVAPNNSALMGSASRQRQGVASAVLGTARNVGMVLGVALSGAVFSTALVANGGAIGPNPGFLPAFQVAFLAVAACGTAGTVTSLVRGTTSPQGAIGAAVPVPVSAAFGPPEQSERV